MRFVPAGHRARSFAAVALLLLPTIASASTPKHSIPGAARRLVPVTGSYRLTVASKHARKTADLIIEQTPDGYVGFILTNENESALTKIEITGDTLRAHVLTSVGDAELVLRITDTGAVGTLKLPMKTLTVTGERAY